jgi:dolichol-phosphate mannosyltransferase
MIAVILPAYNEAAELPTLLERFDAVRAGLDEEIRILVVDDGSSDGTAEVARERTGSVPVRVVVHPENRGLGGALLTGFQETAPSLDPDDAIVTMDTDNTHSPDYVVSLREKMNAEELDVVVASRYASGGEEVGVSLGRRILSRGASVFYRLFFRISGISDYTCGYRMFRAGVVREALEEFGDGFIEERGFPATGEIILKLARRTDRFGEIPFVLRYDMKHTPSKMAKVQTVLHTLKVLWRHRRR